MRRHDFFAGALLFLSSVVIVLCSFEVVTAVGSYETAITLHVNQGTSTVRHELVLPWSLPSLADAPARWHGTAEAAFSQRADGTAVWDAALEAVDASWRAALFVNRNHRSSSDPFKLVHASARGDESIATLFEGSEAWTWSVQYIDGVPLRGRPGSLVAARLSTGGFPFGASYIAYGSERVQHRFAAVDGQWQFPSGIGVQWGAAVQTGVDVEEGKGVGQIVHTSMRAGAAFLRGHLRRGVHSGWLRLHGTGPEFRSLAADTYPFARDKFGLEGRWQWRPGGNRLVSVYGQRLHPLSASVGSERTPMPEYEFEASLSTMPRGQWGWRVTGGMETAGDVVDEASLELTARDPGRRLEVITRLSLPTIPLRRRHRLQWDAGSWRLRLTVDSGFPGRRAEWRVTDYGGWGWIVVFKQRDATEVTPAADWVHVELSRRVTGFGQLWVQYMAPDRGRLDVGWQRPVEVSGGVRISF